MKKAICLGIVLSFLIVFFSFSVNAAVGLTVPVSVNSHYSSGSIEYDITATRLYVNADSVLQGGGTVPYLISARIKNSSSTQDANISCPVINLYFESTTQIMNINNYSSDLLLDIATSSTTGTINPTVSVVPSNNLSYGSNIIIPRNSCVYLIAQIDVTCSFDTQNQVWVSPNMTNCSSSLTGISYGDYPPRDVTDLSSVYVYLANLNANTDGIESILSDISLNTQDFIDALTFTGTYTAPSINGASSSTSDYTDSESGIRYYLRTIITPSYILNYDFEINSGSDQVYSGGTKRYVITQIGRIYIPSGSTYQYGTMSIKEPVVSDTSHRPYVVSVTSNFVSAAYIYGSSVTLINDQPSDLSTARFILATGQNYFVIQYYLDVPLGYTATINTLSNSVNAFSVANLATYSGNSSFSISIKSAINVIKNRITDLLNAYNSVNGTGDVSNDSGTVGSQSDSNHTIEESYYSSNSDAIIATGLSNYRFSNDQSNGIGSVSNDFTAVWNALGSFNSVYIFSLTLSIALMIFRHVPGVIRRRLNTRNDGDG